MTITKKLLAVLLAGLMLVGFGVWVAAETEEEPEAEEIVLQETQDSEAQEVVLQATQAELEAQGRALLMQTMEDLREDYTVRGIVHSGGNYACLNDDGTRELIIGDEVFRVFPDRNAYQRLESTSYKNKFLKPKIVTDETPITVDVFSTTLRVYFDGYRYDYYYQSSGALDSIVEVGAFNWLNMYGFRKGADLSLFSMEGMQEISAQQARRWDSQARIRKFFDNWKAPKLGDVLAFWLDTLIHAPIILPILIMQYFMTPFIWIVQQIYFIFR